MSTRGLILSALGLVLAASAAVASAGAPAAEGKALASSQGCIMCHAAGGMAKPLSSYVGDSARRLEEAILDPQRALGPATAMPAFQGKLSAAQLAALIAYIKAGGG
jgi:mono/diheme cytochrome c family protein